MSDAAALPWLVQHGAAVRLGLAALFAGAAVVVALERARRAAQRAGVGALEGLGEPLDAPRDEDLGRAVTLRGALGGFRGAVSLPGLERHELTLTCGALAVPLQGRGVAREGSRVLVLDGRAVASLTEGDRVRVRGVLVRAAASRREGPAEAAYRAMERGWALAPLPGEAALRVVYEGPAPVLPGTYPLAAAKGLALGLALFGALVALPGAVLARRGPRAPASCSLGARDPLALAAATPSRSLALRHLLSQVTSPACLAALPEGVVEERAFALEALLGAPCASLRASVGGEPYGGFERAARYAERCGAPAPSSLAAGYWYAAGDVAASADALARGSDDAPFEETTAGPRGLLRRAQVHLLAGRFVEAERALQRLERAAEGDDDVTARPLAPTERALVAALRPRLSGLRNLREELRVRGFERPAPTGFSAGDEPVSFVLALSYGSREHVRAQRAHAALRPPWRALTRLVLAARMPGVEANEPLDDAADRERAERTPWLLWRRPTALPVGGYEALEAAAFAALGAVEQPSTAVLAQRVALAPRVAAVAALTGDGLRAERVLDEADAALAVLAAQWGYQLEAVRWRWLALQALRAVLAAREGRAPPSPTPPDGFAPEAHEAPLLALLGAFAREGDVAAFSARALEHDEGDDGGTPGGRFGAPRPVSELALRGLLRGSSARSSSTPAEALAVALLSAPRTERDPARELLQHVRLGVAFAPPEATALAALPEPGALAARWSLEVLLRRRFAAGYGPSERARARAEERLARLAPRLLATESAVERAVLEQLVR